MGEAYTGTMQAVGELATPRELIQPREKIKQSEMRWMRNCFTAVFTN